MTITPEIRAVMAEVMEEFKAGKLEPDLVPWWWERRRDNELTPDYLGRVLAECGLEKMAAAARTGSYDDWHDGDGMGVMRLVVDLRAAAREVADPQGHPYMLTTRQLRSERIAAIENGVRRGEFDATKAEGDRWEASKVGQETMALATPEVRDLTNQIFDAIEQQKVGRNDPCPCGSGKKYKKCHGAPR